MYRAIKNIAALTFIISVTFLTIVAVLAIWDVFDKEVVGKSLSTIGVLAFASLVVITAAKSLEHKTDKIESTNLNQ